MLGFTELFEPVDNFERWSQVVRPHIQGWRKDLKMSVPLFQPGPHVFKVSLGVDCRRRIAIRGET